MAALSTVVALGSLALGAASYANGQNAAEDAADDRRQAAEEQKKIQAEKKAENAAQAAQERRQQIREERVKRARVLQASENTGTEFSSGEFGAIGGLSTQLGSNIGFNLGAIDRANRVSNFSQAGADFMTSAGNNDARAQTSGQLFNLSTSIFSAAGGFGQIKTAWDRGFAGPPKP